MESIELANKKKPKEMDKLLDEDMMQNYKKLEAKVGRNPKRVF